MTHDQQQFIFDVLLERDFQDKQWGGEKHDDTHVYVDWIKFIKHQVGSILILPGGSDEVMASGDNLALFERRMVKVAALAMAAVESAKRKVASGHQKRR